jgi:hypothetical protein
LFPGLIEVDCGKAKGNLAVPFHKSYEGVYEQATLDKLQDIFEFVSRAITDAGAPSVSPEDIARMVIDAHETGVPPDRMKVQLVQEILKTLAGDPREPGWS